MIPFFLEDVRGVRILIAARFKSVKCVSDER